MESNNVWWNSADFGVGDKVVTRVAFGPKQTSTKAIDAALQFSKSVPWSEVQFLPSLNDSSAKKSGRLRSQCAANCGVIV